LTIALALKTVRAVRLQAIQRFGRRFANGLLRIVEPARHGDRSLAGVRSGGM